jgi:predicted transporter
MVSKGDTPKTEGGAKNLLLVVSFVTVLSLATWLFFHVESMPLSPPETTVIVGGWFIVVFLGKFAWQRVRPKKSVDR